MSWPWSELGLPGPAELPEIRRAYAQRLKTTHPEEDPEGFQRLHDAYQEASRQARQRRRASQAGEPEGGDAAPQLPSDRAVQEDGAQEPRESDTQEARDASAGPARFSPEPPVRPSSEEADQETGKGRDEDDPSGPEGPQKTQASDWDYDRLFAEGEAEAQEARRRRLEELREKNRARYAAQEAEQRRRSNDEEEAWAAVMAATQAIELLYSTDAPLRAWLAFLNSPVFWNARANLDFIFALEDFLEQHQDLPEAVRQAFFASYEFEKGPGRPEYKRLYHLLNISGAARRKLRWENSSLRRQWQSWPRRRKFATVFSVVFLALLFIIGFWDLFAGVGTAVGSLLPSPKPAWEETALEWLEEDFGRGFIHPFESERYIFTPDDHSLLYFFAYPDEEAERDLERGALGYQTNYADRMVMAAMEQFAREQDLELGFDSAGGGFQGHLGETPGAYLLQMPLLGKGEAITLLGDLLAELQEEDWYQKLPPDFEVFLCYGSLSFYKSRSTEEAFDADYARSLYENKFGPEMCRYIADKTGTAAKDMGEDAFVLLERGTVAIDGDTFFWVTGKEPPPSNTDLVHYFLSADGSELFAVPAAMLDSNLTQADLRQGGRNTHLLPELGDRSAIGIWDLVPTE